jgi:hypothetical protein
MRPTGLSFLAPQSPLALLLSAAFQSFPIDVSPSLPSSLHRPHEQRLVYSLIFASLYLQALPTIKNKNKNLAYTDLNLAKKYLRWWRQVLECKNINTAITSAHQNRLKFIIKKNLIT